MKILILFISFIIARSSYITINENTNKPYIYGCQEPKYSVLTEGLVGKNNIGGKHFSYMLNWNGAYISKPWNNGHLSESGWEPFITDAAFGDANVHDMGPNITLEDCQDKCTMHDQCIGFTFGKNSEQNSESDYCQMLTQCKKKTVPTNDLNSYIKSSWPDFTPETVSPFSICDGVALDDPSTVGDNTPPTVVQCYEHCDSLEGAEYFQIDDSLECQCFSTCSITQDDNTEDENHQDKTWRTMVYKIGTKSPTGSPTKEPTMPTKEPTGTPAPTTPTGEPTTAAPTGFGTKSVTNSPTTSTDDDESSSGVAIGVTLSIVSLIIIIYLVYRYLKNGGTFFGMGGDRFGISTNFGYIGQPDF